MIDIDLFKQFNDNYGHPAGDQLLTKVASRLKNALRRSDIVARLGGDEFSIILKDVKHDNDFLKLVENLISLFQDAFQINSKPVNITTSMGIAIYPNDSHTAEGLVSYSDMAMYQAKDEGRNTFSFYNQKLHHATKFKHELEIKLIEALRSDEFILFYQPVISLIDDSVSSYEALLRWPDGNGGMHNTEKFITIAEETNLILDIGNWVFNQACKQLQIWQQLGVNNRKISINISAHQFNSDHFTNMVEAYIIEHPELAASLTFELTERKPLANTTENINKLQRLSKLGITFSVDDFGIGHSSLSYLRAFPMNIIKIDRSITSNILESTADLALSKAIIAIGQALNMEVIAEGVETNDIISKLRELNCPHVQGYLYSRPLPVEEVEPWLAQYENAPATVQ